MHGVPKLVYNVIVIPVLWTAMHILRHFNEKIKRGVKGREDLFTRLEADIARLPAGKPRIWFHSSSLGEFEQAKPIIAELKRRDPSVQVVVSFYSPSGYEPSRKYKLADVITYLPFDTVRNARMFVAAIRPTAAVMVRYDVWPNHIDQLAKAGVPVYLANATMRSTSRRFWPGVKSFHSRIYGAFRAILTVSDADASMFERFALKGLTVRAIGDTRFDQVLVRKKEAEAKHLIAPAVLQGKKVLVVGSSWEADEDVLLPVMRGLQAADPSLLMVLVPHEPTIENLERIESGLNGSLPSIRFSNLNDFAGERIILVDSIGILVALYKYAHIAYVGGGFRSGVHNVLEPAVYGIPVIYGPKHGNSQEAVALAAEKAGFVVDDEVSLRIVLARLFTNECDRTAAGKRAGDFVQNNAGATTRFLGYLEESIQEHRK